MNIEQAVAILLQGAEVAETEDGLNDAQRTGSVLREIAALLTRQQAEIEGLKCCGNCKQYEPEFEGCGKQQVIVNRHETCEDWEGAE